MNLRQQVRRYPTPGSVMMCLGTGGVSLDLAAQVADVDPQHMGLLQIGDAPDLLEDLAVGQHLAGMGDQQAQQVVFGRGQLNFLPLRPSPGEAQIHLQLVAVKTGSGACCRERRSATRIRASSSPTPKGLVR